MRAGLSAKANDFLVSAFYKHCPILDSSSNFMSIGPQGVAQLGKRRLANYSLMAKY
jgi:hypothetical protein